MQRKIFHTQIYDVLIRVSINRSFGTLSSSFVYRLSWLLSYHFGRILSLWQRVSVFQSLTYLLSGPLSSKFPGFFCLCAASRSSDSPMSVCVSGSQVAIWDVLSQMFCLPPLSSASGIADSNFPFHHLSVPMACITDQSWSLFMLGLGLSSEFVSTQCFRQSPLRDRSQVCRGSYLLSLAFTLQCKAVR